MTSNLENISNITQEDVIAEKTTLKNLVPKEYVEYLEAEKNELKNVINQQEKQIEELSSCLKMYKGKNKDFTLDEIISWM